VSLIVDSLGHVLKIVVTEANAGERVGTASSLMELCLQYPEMVKRLKLVLVDAGYRGDKFWLLFQAGG
jgi:putative transposase